MPAHAFSTDDMAAPKIRGTARARCLATVALLVIALGAAPVRGQDGGLPWTPPGKAQPGRPGEASPPGITQPQAPGADQRDTLGHELSRSRGVITPPPTGDRNVVPPPRDGSLRTPVSPPPGTPGGNPQIIPK